VSENLFDLAGKTALVTGSSRGLGFTIARGLGRAGAKLILNGRNEERLTQAASELRDLGLDATGCAFDVTSGEQVNCSIPAIEAEVGPIDILVNNAGVNLRGDLTEVDEATWRMVIDTNLTAVFLVSQCVARGMISRKSGKIVNICSLMSEVGRPTTGPYTASKGGLKMLTRAMAVDWARHNLQINGIGPGYFLTEMTRALAEDQEFDAWVKARTPSSRWGDPEELVGASVFLASRASDFVNGHILYVDGGMLAGL